MVPKSLASLAFAILLGLVLFTGTITTAAEPTDALSIGIVRPDRQLERLIALFEGARVPHPAAALAAWKRANRVDHGLGKTLEAAIAALNPGMVRELRNFEGAKLGLGLDPNDGGLRWYLAAPHDDGTLAALVSALILTDGGPEPPYLETEVDRIGRPGSPLSLRLSGQLALAGRRAELAPALQAVRAQPIVPPEDASDWTLRFEPDAFPVVGPVASRRLAALLHAPGLNALEGHFGLNNETLELALTGEFLGPIGGAPIDPAWLDWIPGSTVKAAGVFALDPSPTAWDTLFAWADRVERTDPVNGQLAPLRTRLTLLSIGVGIQPEVDLFPQVRGLTLFAMPDREGGEAGSWAVALHVASPDAAERLATQFLPRLASSLLKRPATVQAAGEVQRLGTVSGRPLEVVSRGSTVLIAWGEDALKAGLNARDEPDRALASLSRAAWGPNPPHRLGVAWPGRLGASLLAESPPVVWIGRNEPGGTRDVIRWAELRGVVKRALERLPLEPFSSPSN